MYGLQRRALSQNFLYSRKLVLSLIRQSSIGSTNVVLDIGVGKGIISEALVPIAKRVIGIELDDSLCMYLRKKFIHCHTFQLVAADFMRYQLPTYRYKVFSNIPFSIEGKIIRKLLDAPQPPDDCYLVMRKDLAWRLSGYMKECAFSAYYKAFFAFSMIHHFRRTDFIPCARMDTVLLRITKRDTPLINPRYKKRYRLLVTQGFREGKRFRFRKRLHRLLMRRV